MISERGFPAIKTSFASKHIAYLKAKDIKHSNRHLHLAFEYDVIHFADQPTKQLCIYFLCKCIPVKIITHSINFNPRARTVVSESENHNSATRTKVIIRVKQVDSLDCGAASEGEYNRVIKYYLQSW